MAFFSYEIDIESPSGWCVVAVPNTNGGRLGLMGFPGLLIGGDSYCYIDPDSLQRTFSKLYQNDCRIFYAFAHSDDLPENALEYAQVAARAAGIEFRCLAIKDFGVPSVSVANCWQQHLPDLLSALENRELIALSCLSGIGRTGMMAADLLVYAGMSPSEAIQYVRESRPEAIESVEQEHWVGTSAT